MDAEEILQPTYEAHREKALDMDAKISESFILATSVIVVYVSTITEKNIFFFLSEVSLLLEIIFSIYSFWILRSFHTTSTLLARDSMDKIRNFQNQDFTRITPQQIREKAEQLGRIDTTEIGKLRKKINLIQKLCAFLFLLGLILLVLIPFQNKILNFLLTVR